MFNTEKTQEEILKDNMIDMAKIRLTHIGTVKAQYQQTFDIVWRSSFHPQDVFDFYGTDAAQLFVEANKIIDYIKSFDPEYEVPMPNYEYTINEDGTVTVGELLVNNTEN